MNSTDILKKCLENNKIIFKELVKSEQEQYRKIREHEELLKNFQKEKRRITAENKEIVKAINILEKEANDGK